MAWTLAFAILLLLGVLISCRARDTVLSTSGLFLIAGLIIGRFLPGTLPPPSRAFLYELANVALFATLFSDGMKVSGAELRSNSGFVTRTLIGGMALTIAITAAAAHFIAGLAWSAALMLGAVLSPTDPVFVGAIFDTRAVPDRVKHILNIESGLNDGLALPAVLLLLSANYHAGSLGRVLLELLGGVALGFVLPWAAIKLEQSRVFGSAGIYQSLNAVAIGVLVYALCAILHVNQFLAAFCAGICVAAVRKEVVDAFHRFGETVTELLKLFTLLIFGARVAPMLFHLLPWTDYIVIVVAVFLARMIAVPVSLFGSGLPRRETWTIAYFGPKGFASVVYAILLLHLSGQQPTTEVATLSGIAVALSVAVYSSTDVLIGQWYERRAN